MTTGIHLKVQTVLQTFPRSFAGGPVHMSLDQQLIPAFWTGQVVLCAHPLNSHCSNFSQLDLWGIQASIMMTVL